MASLSLRIAVCALYSGLLLTPLMASDSSAACSQALAQMVASFDEEFSPAGAGAGGVTPSSTDMSASPASDGSPRSLSPVSFTPVEDETVHGQLVRALCLLFGIDGFTKNSMHARRILRPLSVDDDISAALKGCAAFWAGLPSNEDKRITALEKVVTDSFACDAAQFKHEIAFLLGVHFLKKAKVPGDESYMCAVGYFGMIVKCDVYRKWLPATIAFYRLSGEERVPVDGYCERDIRDLYATVGVQTLAQEFERLTEKPFFPEYVPYIPTGPAR